MYHKIGIIFATLLLAVATLAKAQNNSTLSYIVQYIRWQECAILVYSFASGNEQRRKE